MTPQEVESLIRTTAQKYSFTDPDLLVATARQESSLNPGAIGDQGHSVGIFQENDRGRGTGLSSSQRMDVVGSTQRAIQEFNQIRARNPNVDRGTWAALSQRPYDPTGYARSVNSLLGGSAAAGPAAAGAVDGNAPAWYRDLLSAGDAGGAPNAPTRAPQPVDEGAPAWYRDLLSSGSVGAGTGSPAGARAPRTQQVAQGDTSGRGGELWPVVGEPWGKVNNPFGGVQSRSAGATVALPSSNVGADLTAPYGAQVVAPVSGTIVSAYDAKNEHDPNENSGWGGSTLLQGDNGYFYRLSHAKPGSLTTRPGERVEQGTVLQRVGISGNSTGSHLDAEKFDRPGHFVDIVSTPQGASSASASGRGGVPAASSGSAPAWYRELMGG